MAPAHPGTPVATPLPGKHLNGFYNVMLVFIEINVRNRGNNRAMLNQMVILVLYFKTFQSVVCLIQAASSSA